MSGFRKYGRVRADYIIEINSDEYGDFKAKTRDISETGVFICNKSISRRVCVGDQVNATWENSSKCVIKACMTVVRKTHDGIGLIYE